MGIKFVHPFPARMAPEIAVAGLDELNDGAKVLDPMMGSGTVLHEGVKRGMQVIGRDIDPMAVLMSRVACDSETEIEEISNQYKIVAHNLDSMYSGRCVEVPWIDEDPETRRFVDYWFGIEQQSVLRPLALEIQKLSAENPAVGDVFKVALARTIITKDSGASLARDVSHSRPHKVRDFSDYDVREGFEKSLNRVGDYLRNLSKDARKASIEQGDVRNLADLENQEVDRVITSPPYFNAIDYMRGHRLALVWLGMSMSQARKVRSDSVGAEKMLNVDLTDELGEIFLAYGDVYALPNRLQGMLKRYAVDLSQIAAETFRVMKVGAKATFVVGDSCLRGIDVKNSEALKSALEIAGFKEVGSVKRQIPLQNRYLPVDRMKKANGLEKRMRHEVVMTYERV